VIQVAELQGGYFPPPVPPAFDVSQPPPAPLVEVIESFKGPWNKSGSYGQQQNFSYPIALADAEPITVFSNDGLSGPPGPRTLHLYRSDVSLGAGNAEIYARITYGVGGIQNQFLCDWVRGGQIALVCQTVRVEAVVYQPTSLTPYSRPAGVEVLGCMLGQRGSAPPKPPTFTTQVQQRTVSAIDELDFDIPDYARWAYPNQIPLTTTSAQNTTSIMLFRSNGAGRMRQLVVSEALMREGSAIPGGATVVSFLNQGPANESYSVTFALGL
jgi:hypothetical protein